MPAKKSSVINNKLPEIDSNIDNSLKVSSEKYISDLEKKNNQLQKEAKKYHDMFDNSDISIWNEDFSQIIEMFKQIRLEGITDLRNFLAQNMDITKDLASKVKVIEVNKATHRLFKANSDMEFIKSIDKVFGDNAIDIFIEGLCAIWEGKTYFRSEAEHLTLEGDKITVMLTMPIPELEEEFNSIPVCLVDITAQKLAEALQQQSVDSLQQALDEIKTLKGVVPICSVCKGIRDDNGYWNKLEHYIQNHTDATFSHGMCPDCMDNYYGDDPHYIKMKLKHKKDDNK